MTTPAFSPYYDRAGRPISLEEWCGLFEGDFQRHRLVAQHFIAGWKVSTVWLGLDHNHWDGPPHIFETMIFAPSHWPDGEGLDQSQWRYATEAEAEDGHWEAIRLLARELCLSLDSVLTGLSPLHVPFTTGYSTPVPPARRRQLRDSLSSEPGPDAMRWRPE